MLRPKEKVRILSLRCLRKLFLTTLLRVKALLDPRFGAVLAANLALHLAQKPVNPARILIALILKLVRTPVGTAEVLAKAN
jgi:hypothetical protein